MIHYYREKEGDGSFYEVCDAFQQTPGEVHFTRQGGGWVGRLPEEEFKRRFRKADYAFRCAVTTWKPGVFCLHDHGPFPGWSTDYRWNGWHDPVFTLGVCRQIASEVFNEGKNGLILPAGLGELFIAPYDWDYPPSARFVDGGFFWDDGYGNCEVWCNQVDIRGFPHFSFGDSWCWYALEGDDDNV